MKANIIEEISTSSCYQVIGLAYMKNGCCSDRPVAITASTSGVISAQCACGGWCTNGHKTATAALLEYRHMSNGRGLWDYQKMDGRVHDLELAIARIERSGRSD